MPFGGLLTVGIIGAVGSIAGGALSSHAAGKAADAQAQASEYAADKQAQAAAESLAFQKQVYGDQTTNLAPYLAQGRTSLADLAAGIAPGGQFDKKFTASDMASLDPGYDFRLGEGMKALERAQAAGGSIGSGGALKEATQYAQNFASGEFGNAYSRFMNTQDTRFNRLAALAGVGQTATAQASANGNAAAGNIANINQSAATGIGNAAQSAANATASGYVGSANAWNSALGSLGSNGSNLLLMSKLGAFGGGGSATPYYGDGTNSFE